MNEYLYKDIYIGMEESFSVVITEKMMERFYNITQDNNPLHNDEKYAKEKGYDSRVGYGLLTASFLSTLAGVYLPGKNSLIHGVDVEFPNPVYIGDELTIWGKVTAKDDRFKYFTLKVIIRNQNNKKVCRGKMRIGVMQ